MKESNELLDKLHQAQGEKKKRKEIAKATAAKDEFEKFHTWNVYTVFAFLPGSDVIEEDIGCTTMARMSVALLVQFVVPILLAVEGPGDSGWCPNKGKGSIKITGMVMMLVCCVLLLPGLYDVRNFLDLSNKLQSSKVSRSWSFHIGSRLNTLANLMCVFLTPPLLFLLYISADELSLADVVLNALALNFLVEVDNLLVFNGMEEEAKENCRTVLEKEKNSIKSRRTSKKGSGVCNVMIVLHVYMAVVIIATPICL